MPCRKFAARFSLLLLIAFLSVATLLELAAQSATARTTETRRVIILLIDQLTWGDLLNKAYPTLSGLANHAAVGLMNTRTGGVTNSANAAVTLGASSRALATANSGQAFDRHTPLQIELSTTGAELFVSVTDQVETGKFVTAAEVYQRRTGKTPTGNILHLTISEIVARNQRLQYTVVPGALGSALKEAGIPVAYFGNSDTTRPNRHLTAFLMDKNGTIPLGTVETPTRFDPTFPLNRRTDYKALWDLVQKTAPEEGVIAIELGELATSYATETHYNSQAQEKIRRRILQDIDEFVKLTLKQLNSDDKLLVLVPTPPSHQVQAGDTFSPLLLWTPDPAASQLKPITGLLTSPTTRRLGIVTNTDIAPTILSFFGIETPPVMYGRAMSIVEHEAPLPYLLNLREQTTATNNQRRSILRNLVYADIFLYLAATVVMLLKKLPHWIGRIISYGLPFMKSMPLALLLLPLWGPTTPTSALLGAIALSGVIFLIVSATSHHPLKLITNLSLVTATAVLIDTLTGNHLVKMSILGYDPMGGARFYGIGNEYMGVLVGAAIIGTTPLLDLYPRWTTNLRRAIVLFYLLMTATVSLPVLGANVGGALTATLGCGVTVMLLYNRRITWRTALAIVLIPIMVIVANSIVDNLVADWGPSHLGQALRLVSSRGLEEIHSIITRKLAMNLKLFRYSIWSRALIIALGVIIWFLYQPPPLIQKIKKKYPNLIKGLIGSTTAAIAALVFNDSGVVAAALVLNFTATVILFLGVRLTFGASID